MTRKRAAMKDRRPFSFATRRWGWALLVVLGVCLAGSAWGQDLQIAELGKIREKLR